MTEIALVADLHGNLPAVEALERDLTARRIRRVWCLGDMVGKGPSSAETLDWAAARCEVMLQGNWDEGISRKLFANDAFYYAQLGERRMAMLRELPLEHICLCSGRRLRLLHGRPIMPAALGVQSDAAVFAPFFAPDFDVVGYADAHRQGLRVLNEGILFNTGSVGNGLGVPMVQYAILRGEMDSDRPAPLDIAMVTRPYDRVRTIADTDDAERRGLRNAEPFRNEIRTGRYSR